MSMSKTVNNNAENTQTTIILVVRSFLEAAVTPSMYNLPSHQYECQTNTNLWSIQSPWHSSNSVA